MPRSRDYGDAAIPKHVVIAFEFSDGLLRLEPANAHRVRPLIFGLLHEQHGLGKQVHVAHMVGVGVRDRKIFDVSGLTPRASSWDASVFGRRQWVARGSLGA